MESLNSNYLWGTKTDALKYKRFDQLKYNIKSYYSLTSIKIYLTYPIIRVYLI